MVARWPDVRPQKYLDVTVRHANVTRRLWLPILRAGMIIALVDEKKVNANQLWVLPRRVSCGQTWAGSVRISYARVSAAANAATSTALTVERTPQASG